MQKIVPLHAKLIPPQAKCVFRGEIFDTYQWQQTVFDDTQATFEMLRRPDTVRAIAIKDDKLVMIDERQPHFGRRLGFPGGRVDKEDASWLAAVQRETREEVGMSFAHWRLIDVQQRETKMEWFLVTYIAWDVREETEAELDSMEKVDVKLATLAEAKEMLAEQYGFVPKFLAGISSVAQLQKLPEFIGQTVDR